MMAETTPAKMIPNKSRYSMKSEYDTCGEDDDSDTSLYYSIIDNDFESPIEEDKENKSGKVTVSAPDSVSRRNTKAMPKTPLLRKVLEKQQATPRNQNNKRVSFSASPKTIPILAKKTTANVPAVPEVSEPITQELEQPNTNGVQSIENVIQAIEEQREHNGLQSTGEQPEQTDAVSDDSEESDLHKTMVENDSDRTIISIEAVGDQIFDVAENVEIPMVNGHAAPTSNGAAANEEIKPAPVENVGEVQSTEKVKKVGFKVENHSQVIVGIKKPVVAATNVKTNAVVATKTAVKSAVVKAAAPTANKKVAALAPVKTATKTAPVAKAMEASATTGTISAKKPTRQTTYKRRSLTFEPPKYTARKSLAVLSKVAKQINKTVPVKPADVPASTSATTSKPPMTRRTLCQPTSASAAKQKPRPSMVPVDSGTDNKSQGLSRPIVFREPRFSIYSSRPTRPSVSANTSAVRIQRRQTKSFISSVATTTLLSASQSSSITGKTNTAANVASSKTHPSAKPATVTPKAASPRPATVISKTASPKPSVSRIPVSSPGASVTVERKVAEHKFTMPKSTSIPKIFNGRHGSTGNVSKSSDSSSFKCKYCDRVFAKSHGLDVHLLEKCEKIPASQRRLLTQNGGGDVNSSGKQVFGKVKRAFNLKSKNLIRLDRFLDEITDEAASQNAGVDKNAAVDLQNVKEEMKKIKNIPLGHSGIIRTPKKAMTCHVCKRIFLDVVEYAEHCTNHQIAAMATAKV